MKDDIRQAFRKYMDDAKYSNELMDFNYVVMEGMLETDSVIYDASLECEHEFKVLLTKPIIDRDMYVFAAVALKRHIIKSLITGEHTHVIVRDFANSIKFINDPQLPIVDVIVTGSFKFKHGARTYR
jgi:hypothetical protein